MLGVARVLLNQNDFDVIDAQSAADVLKMFEIVPDMHLDAMIVDVVMPGMHGLDLFEKVQELRPGLPVLFMSGYGENAPPVSDIMGRKLAFIRKPFTAVGLISKIWEVLGVL